MGSETQTKGENRGNKKIYKRNANMIRKANQSALKYVERGNEERLV